MTTKGKAPMAGSVTMSPIPTIAQNSGFIIRVHLERKHRVMHLFDLSKRVSTGTFEGEAVLAEYVPIAICSNMDVLMHEIALVVEAWAELPVDGVQPAFPGACHAFDVIVRRD